ncbi:hypothetical protein C9374_005224 [Naegleria lovaniensis]|uniref:BLOC-2 complex member HPS3 C-terminal domain-containing protein n=1 Tax=Naegleria lovaniensis TaxID=51637 RepID=A0AA88GP50_NAELO|nr:uncharacterized protein C9374_005224 [Naegleria lovaniensis]KAG2382644.1 hypothetical protein C9374_005224 [Naegleria lovaniensis]
MNSHNIRVFQSQDILCPSELGQPLCSAASEGLFWVAFSGIIKGYATQTTQKEFQCMYEFQPLWSEVDAIHYLPDIRRVITVERRMTTIGTAQQPTTPTTPLGHHHHHRGGSGHASSSNNNILGSPKSSGDFSNALKSFSQSSSTATPTTNQNTQTIVEQCCRIYRFEYDKKERKTIIYPFSLPIQNFVSTNSTTTSTTLTTQANSATTSQAAKSGMTLSSELLISVCTYSNQLLTCAKDVISLWKFTNNIETPICILKLHTSWHVKCISVFNQFIGYGTDKDVRVIELKQKETELEKTLLENSQDDDINLNNGGTNGEESTLAQHVGAVNVCGSVSPNASDHSDTQKKKSSRLTEIQKRIQAHVQEQIVGTNESPQSQVSQGGIITRHQSLNPLNKAMAMYWGVSQLHESIDEIQIRFDMGTKDLLPSPATQSYGEPVRISDKTTMKKGNHSSANNIAYDIFGQTPTVDHPAFVNHNYIDICINLLHKHFTLDESPRSIHFLQNISQKKDFNQNTGMKCIISTSTCGYVYSLSSPQSLLCEFQYTDECLMSAVNSLFLYAITPVGLEVWSVLGGSNGCLLRFHPFIGLKSVSATNNHVVLISKISSNENFSIAAYYNQQTDKTVLVSDIRNVEKMNRNASPSKDATRSGRLFPIFNARKKREDSSSSTLPSVEEFSYNIYMLNAVELSDIYEDMLEHAMMFEKSDKPSYMKLLKESHSLLQSKYFELLTKEKKLERSTDVDAITLLKTKIELQNYTTLLKRSFGLQGDAYVSMENTDLAAYAYANSDKPMADIFTKLSVREESLLLFLEHILFDKENHWSLDSLSEDLGNQILTIYKQRIPHTLSTVILANSFPYSKTHALSLLEEINLEYVKAQQLTLSRFEEHSIEKNDAYPQQGDQVLSWFEIMPKDAMVLALLHLQTGNEEKAVAIFKSVESHVLVEFVVLNPSLLAPNTTSEQYSKLAFVFRKHFPWCLVESITRLTASNSCPLRSNQVMDLLKGENLQLSENVETPLTSLFMQQIYLSTCLISNDPSNDSTLKEIALLLMLVFVQELTQITSLLKETNIKDLVNATKQKVLELHSPSSSAQSPINDVTCDHMPSTKRLFSYMDNFNELRQYCSFIHYSLIPFRENLGWLREFVNYEFNRNHTQLNILSDSKDILSEKYAEIINILDEISISENTLFSITENDPLFLLVHTLQNAQGLICYFVQFVSTNRMEIFSQFIEIIQDHEGKFIGFDNLKLLCMMGSKQFKQAIERLLIILGQEKHQDHSLDVLFGFIESHCSSLSDWKDVLDLIFSHLKEYEQEKLSTLVDSVDASHSTAPTFLYALLDRILKLLARSCTPDDFLPLIPKNGSMKFFYRYIHLCFSNFSILSSPFNNHNNTFSSSTNSPFEIL